MDGYEVSTYFYSQNLSNQAPEHMFLGSTSVPIDSKYPPGQDRIQFVNELAQRRGSIKRTIDTGDSTYAAYSFTKDIYLIELYSEEYDESGRRRTVLVSGQLDQIIDAPEQVVFELRNFLSSIDYQVKKETINNILHIAAAFKRKKKAFRKWTLVFTILVIIATLALLVVKG